MAAFFLQMFAIFNMITDSFLVENGEYYKLQREIDRKNLGSQVGIHTVFFSFPF